MQIDWWTLGLQTLNVLVLLWILNRFLFRPVAGMIAKRQATIAESLEKAQATQAEAAAERDKAQAETARLAAAQDDLLQEAARKAEAEKKRLLGLAREKADQLLAEAAAEAARRQESDTRVVADRASRLAIDIAAKLLERLPPDLLVTGFIDGLAEATAALPETTRAQIGSDGRPLRLTAARALSQSETQDCAEALSKALGRPVELAVQVDPHLIAGFEIESAHAAVRNSLRADLDRLAAELTQHDHD